MPPLHDKKLHEAKRAAPVEPPSRSNRFVKLKGAHVKSAETGHAPARPTFVDRLAGRGFATKKPVDK